MPNLAEVRFEDGEILTLDTNMQWHANTTGSKLQEVQEIMKSFDPHPAKGEPIIRLVNLVAKQMGGQARINHRLLAPSDANVVY